MVSKMCVIEMECAHAREAIMFSGSSIEIDPQPVMATAFDDDWKQLHRRLRSIAKRRVTLEAEEASCLIEADESRLYRRLGYTTMVEYDRGGIDRFSV